MESRKALQCVRKAREEALNEKADNLSTELWEACEKAPEQSVTLEDKGFIGLIDLIRFADHQEVLKKIESEEVKGYVPIEWIRSVL